MRPPGYGLGGRRFLAFAVPIVALVVAWTSAVILLGGEGDEVPAGEASLQSTGEVIERHDVGGKGGDRAVRGEVVANRPRTETPETKVGAGAPRAKPHGEEGVADEPGGHDPLGVGAGPNQLSPTERDRARMAAFHFVRHAYDRPGDDREEYLSGVTQAVVSPEFFETPGGEVVGTIADRVARGGVDGPAAFEGFEVGREGLDGVEGVATFRLGGDRRYEQELELVRWGATWRVNAAGEVREAGR